MVEGAITSNLDRKIINSLVSSAYSAQITFLWRQGSSKIAQWLGEGKAMQDAAVAQYLTLRPLQDKGFLTLTVPSDMLDPNVLAKFQTVERKED